MAYKFEKLEATGELKALSENVRLMQAVLLVLVAGLIFALAGILMATFSQKQASYNDLQDEVYKQNLKLEDLTHELELQRVRYELQVQSTTSASL